MRCRGGRRGAAAGASLDRSEAGSIHEHRCDAASVEAARCSTGRDASARRRLDRSSCSPTSVARCRPTHGPLLLFMFGLSEAAAAARRGFPVRHPADQGDSPAAQRRRGTRARRGRTRRLRLVGRHANRRRDRALQHLVEPPRAHPEGDRAHHQRWLGPRPVRSSCDARWPALQRSSHRLVWLNPLLGSPSYEPAARGMQAALPYIDAFPGPSTIWRAWRSWRSCWPTSRRGTPAGGNSTRG